MVELEIADRVATITLARAEAHNALDDTMIAGLGKAFAAVEVAVHDTAFCVLLRAEGVDFSVGGDLKALAAGNLDAGYVGMRRIQEGVRRLASLGCPVVTAVQGNAAGAGCSLAIAGDIVLASDDARFSMAFVNAGLVPDFGGLWFMVRRLGAGRTLDLALTGRIVEASEALQLGLADRLVPAAELDDSARKLAAELAAKAPFAASIIKRAVDRVAAGGIEAAFETEALAQQLLRESDDHQRLLAAFLDRRRDGRPTPEQRTE